jgi:16S rRNA (guanine527-N7)-methyltransferase
VEPKSHPTPPPTLRATSPASGGGPESPSPPPCNGGGGPRSGGGGEVNDAHSFAAATNATAAQIADLERFRGLLAEWNERMNLVGPSALEVFWGRHAFDSAQLLGLAPEALTWADLGAGAGFPGLVLAILLKGRPGARVHLVESLAKRCRFLGAVIETLDLPAEVHQARAESLSLTVDIVTARACAPAGRLFEFAWPYLRNGATGLFLKGQDIEAELAEATKSWDFEAERLPSRSSPSGRILLVKRLRRARR